MIPPITRSESTADRLIKAQDTIKIMALLIVLMTVTLGLAVNLICKDVELIKAQDEVIASLEAQIQVLNIEKTELAEMVEELKVEQVKAVSRGVGRTATITAYTHTGNPTASGTMPVAGRTAAGPRWIPLGTKVWIDGVGERIIEDRTHIRFNGRYDVFMDTEAECVNWGIQERVVR